MHTNRMFTVELKVFINFDKMEMRSDLYRTITSICNAYRFHGASGINFNLPSAVLISPGIIVKASYY